MDNAHSTHLAEQRMAEWFSRQRAHQEDKKPEGAPVDWRTVITISRQYGAGGHNVAERVCKAMGPEWKVWDREIIDDMAESAHIRREMIETMDEHVHTWLEQMVRDVFGVTTMEVFAYRRHLAQVLLSIALQGHVVIVGRGANYLMKNALNVRLRASHQFRLSEIMKAERLTREEAERKMQAVEKKREEFTWSVFERHVDDIDAYDMILQTDVLGWDATTVAIVSAARTIMENPA